MKNVNPKETNLVYQKQLFSTLKRIVELRTQLIADASQIANDGKAKEWPSITSQVKFVRKQIGKTTDENLIVILSILKSLEEPILKLETNLELKNSFRQIVQEQTLTEIQEPELQEAL